MRVLLFGLSANPPTGMAGHAGLVRWAASRPTHPELGGPLDALWVLPVYRHAFGDKRQMVAFEHRMAMAKLAFEGLPGLLVPVEVKDTERRVWLEKERVGEVDTVVGTIDLVQALLAEHPGIQLGLLLGADTFRDLQAGRWKASGELLATVKVVVVPRIGVDLSVPRPDGPALGPISSSALRASRDPAVWAAALQPEVWAYVQAHHLYGF
ncbi:MAG: nicotinate-nicotinamide nucleotide adenylyltransferase [Deltaproteobacteria bacterium]|nr:nicotinate-nicotinamide nucleotide adenylyltransferase [Deltaproteobacteria bacterium]